MKERTKSAVIILLAFLPGLRYPAYLVAFLAILAGFAFGEVVNVKKDKTGKKFSLRNFNKKNESNMWEWWVQFILFAGFLLMLYWGTTPLIFEGADLETFNIVEPKQIMIVAMVALILPVFSKKFTSDDSGYTFMMSLFIAVAFRAIVWTIFYFHGTDKGLHLAVFPVTFTWILLLTFSGDVFAYLSGRWFGKTKLAPNVSPKKTWEGLIGSLIVTTLAGIFMHFMLFDFWDLNQSSNEFPLWLAAVMAPALMLVGALGDLAFSKIKRDNEIKDFANVLPGHGGILDRFDSLFFTSMTFFVIYNFLEVLGVINK